MQVRLGEEMTKPAALETYARAVFSRPRVAAAPPTSSGDQGSSMLQSLTRADCLSCSRSASRSFQRARSSRRSPCDDCCFRSSERRRGTRPARGARCVICASRSPTVQLPLPVLHAKSRFGPGHRFLPRADALDAEEIVRLAGVFVARGDQDPSDRRRATAPRRPRRHRRGHCDKPACRTSR